MQSSWLGISSCLKVDDNLQSCHHALPPSKRSFLGSIGRPSSVQIDQPAKGILTEWRTNSGKLGLLHGPCNRLLLSRDVANVRNTNRKRWNASNGVGKRNDEEGSSRTRAVDEGELWRLVEGVHVCLCPFYATEMRMKREGLE